MKKFSLTKNTKDWFGITLFQIKAEISFLRLYSEPKEGELIKSIIAYNKHPKTVTRKQIEYDPCSTTTLTHYDFVNQYEKRLSINLWFVILYFYWETKYIN